MKGVRENYFKDLKDVIKSTFKGFSEHKIMKMSASLAYTTVFSLAPLLLVVLYLCGLFWERNSAESAIYNQIQGFIGKSSADQLQIMMKSIVIEGNNSITLTIGIITLLIGATSVFSEIQDSINTIWGIKPKEKSGFWLYLKSRLLSFGVIGSLGFILLVSLGFSIFLDSLNETLQSHFSNIAIYLIYTGNLIVTFLIITILFASIFTILPDAEINFKQVKTASIATAILFMIGKFLISYYISKSNIGSIYGSAGSLVILMVWVYYSSLILYLGAEFAKCYALEFTAPIRPSAFAEIVQSVDVVIDEKTIQKADEKAKEIKNANQIPIKAIKLNEN